MSYPEIAIAGSFSCNANGLLGLYITVIGRLQHVLSNKSVVIPKLCDISQDLARDPAMTRKHIKTDILSVASSGRG